jgi:DNA invertase Pin-like site-specific DNA recombinase
MMVKLVAYYRVSTEQQGRSGLGLEAQRAAVEAYAKATGSQITKEFTEVESGKRSDRPELAKALAFAKRSKCVLCVAKIDRLSRNVAFLSRLMDAGVDFVACDNPQANRLTIHILVAVAEDEARRISERTKAALAAYVARGGVLGKPENLTPDAADRGRKSGVESIKKSADEAYEDLYVLLLGKRSAGLSLQGIADHLNAEGYLSRRGKAWNKSQVMLVLQRAQRLGVVAV